MVILFTENPLKNINLNNLWCPQQRFDVTTYLRNEYIIISKSVLPKNNWANALYVSINSIPDVTNNLNSGGLPLYKTEHIRAQIFVIENEARTAPEYKSPCYIFRDIGIHEVCGPWRYDSSEIGTFIRPAYENKFRQYIRTHT